MTSSFVRFSINCISAFIEKEQEKINDSHIDKIKRKIYLVRRFAKSLKKTLCKIQDKTEKCRGLMRYTWECVIRGNVVELENLSIQLSYDGIHNNNLQILDMLV